LRGLGCWLRRVKYIKSPSWHPKAKLPENPATIALSGQMVGEAMVNQQEFERINGVRYDLGDESYLTLFSRWREIKYQ